MTVTAVVPKNAYTAAGGTIFPYTFTIFDASEILVYVAGVLTATGFTVDNVGVTGGGNVTFAVAPANGIKILLVRRTIRNQGTDWTANDPDPAESKERAFDKAMNIDQEQDDTLSRVPQYDVANASIITPKFDTPVVGAFAQAKDSAGNIAWATPALGTALSNPVSLAQGGTGSNFASVDALTAGLSIAKWKLGASLTAAATLALPNPLDGNRFPVTGNTTITALAAVGVTVGTIIALAFTGTPQLTSSASLQMFASTNHIAAANEVIYFEYLGSGAYREILRIYAIDPVNAPKFWRGDGTWQDIPGSLAWVTPAYNAGDFTASGAMTWTVDSGDITTYAYNVRGKTITVSFTLVTTSVGGTPSTELRVKIPGGFTAAKTMENASRASDNGGASAVGVCQVQTGLTYIRCFVNPTGGTNWTASANNTTVSGNITFEIQ